MTALLCGVHDQANRLKNTQHRILRGAAKNPPFCPYISALWRKQMDTILVNTDIGAAFYDNTEQSFLLMIVLPYSKKKCLLRITIEYTEAGINSFLFLCT